MLTKIHNNIQDKKHRFMERIARFISSLLAPAIFVSVITPASAIDVDPLLIDQFMRMDPTQQQALAAQYGVDLSQFGGGASGRGFQEDQTKQQVSVLTRSGQSQDPSKQTLPRDDISGEESSARYQVGKLVPFGYELFAGAPSTFEPVNDIPVSNDYVLGPGDTLKVELYGKESKSYQLGIDAQGKVHFPELGPMNVAGLSFEEVKNKLRDEVSKRMIGMKASISMGELKSIRVFVLGEAYVPGSYVVSSLSTITNALVLSGGISESGSLRNIQLKRKGELVQTLDLYELLLKGDTSNDAALRSGDVVFIPPVGNTAGVDGEVRRPAIYEFKEGETLSDLLGFAGGLKPSAYPKKSTLERINDVDQRTVLNVSAKAEDLNANPAQAGDILRIPSVLEKVEDTIALRGHVYRPGVQSFKDGMRLTDVISSVDQLKPGSDLRYGLVKRYLPPQQTLKVLSFRIDRALADPSSEYNVELQSKDEILVFGLYPRDQKLSPEYEEMAAQAQELASSTAAFSDVRMTGLPLDYQASSTDNAQSPLLDRDRAHSRTRFTVTEFEKEAAYWGRKWVIDEILEELRAQSEIGNPSQEVRITGSVRYPGDFPLVDGMNVEDLIYAAGGLTEKAYKLSAEINRTDFDEQQKRIQARYEIDLNMAAGREFEFKSRDVLQIRGIPEWVENHYVELKGEVRFPGVYPIHKDDELRDVLKRAGGVTNYAYVPGAVFTRIELKEQQEKRLQEMQRRLAEDIAKAQLVEKDASRRSGDIGKAQELLTQLQQTPALGRLVVDLRKVLAEDPDYSIPLQNGDALTIPSRKNSVTIIGEVQLPISQVFEPKLDYTDYIERSGGTTDKADEDRIYIIKANGGVQLPDSGHWFASNDAQMEPGDTVVVPLDADKLDQLVLWRDLSQIFYQIALGAAAVGSL
ncbi:SLBB domain-containing protein [Oleiphilus sp. HI0125]|uniref:SLBB domain-containing protein n=2 Tax=Oleiphilus sp. HI0125 TaxID=1822266 RepID=UPI0009EE7FB7|nr:SLBB domain-containing protein [Oleiphilus sp. HI0125]